MNPSKANAPTTSTARLFTFMSLLEIENQQVLVKLKSLCNKPLPDMQL
jgi:hypothetical protein